MVDDVVDDIMADWRQPLRRELAQQAAVGPAFICAGFCLPAGLAALKAAADNPEGSFTSAAAEAARSPAAETGLVLAAPALAAPALAAPAVWAEGEEVAKTGPALAAPALAAPALAAPALAAPALAAPALAAPALAAPALAAPAVWAEGEEVSATGLCGCTKPITTVAVGGLHSSWPASRLPVLSSKALPTGSISSLCALKKSTPKMGKATFAKRNFHEKSRSWNQRCTWRSPQQGIG